MWLMTLLPFVFVAGCLTGIGTNDSSTPSSAKLISAYSLSGNAGVVNEPAKSITVTVPFGTPVTALVATFTTNGVGVKVGTTTQISTATANDFTSPVTYTITADDGSTVAYTVTVVIAAASANAISAYSFVGYPGATGTVGKVAPYAILVVVPTGTSRAALVATFTTNGASVRVGATTQASGTTANDFTNPVTYTVTAADGTTATYTVTVKVALATSKGISAFSFVGYPNSTGTITGSASPYAIAVSVPSFTNLAALTATFTTSGLTVSVGNATQTSGTTSNSFTSSPVAYTVHAADASMAVYNVTVTKSALANPTAPTLGEAGRYAILSSQGISGGAGSHIINGDIGVEDQARTSMTGFTPTHSPADGLFNEVTGSTWVDMGGMLSSSYAPDDTVASSFPAPLAYASPHTAYATTLAMINQSRTDLGVAYTFLAADPNPGAATQVCPTELGGLTLTPGVYKTGAGVGISTPLQLDAQGDPNAVWIFSIDGTLTTAASMSFVGGVGSAKNVYWRVAGITAIAGGTTFYGNVFDYANVNVGANATITGTLFSTTAAVTLITDVITKP